MNTMSTIKSRSFITCLTLVMLLVVTRVDAVDISQAKLLPDGTSVSITSKIVSFASTNYFYIQEANNDTESSDFPVGGIRVEKTSNGFTAGKWVNVSGTIQTNSSKERYISCSSASTVTTGTATVVPYYMNNKDIGGGNWNYDSNTTVGQAGSTYSSGLNNVGMLIRTTGIVNYIDSSSTYIYIDDGSAIRDGNGLDPTGADIPGIRVILGSVTAPVTTAYVSITGVSSLAIVAGQPVGAILASSSQQLSTSTTASSMNLIRIPEGTFLMGNSAVGDDAIQGYPREYPQHSVYLDTFWISKREVTRGQYRSFISAGGYTNSSYWSTAGWTWKTSVSRTQPDYWTATENFGLPSSFTQTDSYPVVGVTYYEAEAFCKWAGGRLPTEAEWEKAARWDGTPRIYPWGNSPTALYSNNWYDSTYKGSVTCPVGSYSAGASPAGCLDMAGNVWEWTSDWYASYPGSEVTFDKTNTYRSVRGGGWYGIYGDRCACRWFYSPSSSSTEIGFRIASD